MAQVAGATPELIPARMLNEFCYCPRLGYLEFAQGEFAHNPDTLEGRFGHRRADKPDERPVPTPGERKANAPDQEAAEEFVRIHARSIMLSAPDEGLVAGIDILEVEGNVATPVDYKRGRAPVLPEGAYEPERVQLCAQALVLRANGYQCDHGIIYFIQSKQRVEIAIDDLLVERTRELLRDFRQTLDAGRIPLPLVDSPKCPRCSLVGICLPDETHLLTQPDEPAANEQVRRLLPARDDAMPTYVKMQGGQIGKSGERLTVKLKGEAVDEVRFHDLSQLCIFGNVQITTQALQECLRRDVPVCYFTYGGYFQGITTALSHKNIELRINQFRTADHTEQSLTLAKAFIRGKILNCRTLLRRHLEDDPDRLLPRLAESAEQVERVTSAESLLGIEGTAARIYFQGFARLIKGGAAFRFEDRNRRPPRDPINAILSFLYSLLAKEFTVTLTTIGLDPMLGFYHKPRYGRPALALDIAEEFRPLIADSVALTLVNTGEMNESHFVQRAGACTMTETGRKALLGAYERRLDSLVTHSIFGYKVSYRRILEVQCRLLSRVLTGEINEYPNFLTR